MTRLDEIEKSNESDRSLVAKIYEFVKPGTIIADERASLILRGIGRVEELLIIARQQQERISKMEGAIRSAVILYETQGKNLELATDSLRKCLK